jgi:hypothetical protein
MAQAVREQDSPGQGMWLVRQSRAACHPSFRGLTGPH